MQGNKLILPFILASMLVFSACQESMLDEEPANTPLGNFDALWDAYDKTYGAFEAKNINWDSLRTVYRARLTDKSNDSELFTVLTGLLSHLDDGHVQLMASGFRRFFSSGAITLFPDSKYYENEGVRNTFYKLDFKDYISVSKYKDNFIYGYLKSSKTRRRVGYLLVPTFSYTAFRDTIVDLALESFKTADAIVLDLRYNGGGATQTFLKLLNRFADKKRLYLKSKLRNGPKHTDFTQIYEHYMEPKYGVFEAKPVVVLVNRFSASSSEHFMLGMKVLPYVTIIGDTTSGALSTVLENVLPNGWQFRTCPQVLCDTLGNYLRDSHGRYPDGVGLCPDVYVVNYYADIFKGHDYMLEKAVTVIEGQVK
jgi:carboxyl-terminal processing protease